MKTLIVKHRYEHFDNVKLDYKTVKNNFEKDNN